MTAPSHENDLDDLIAGLSPDVPLPRLAELAPARGRVTAAIQKSMNAERVTGALLPSSSAAPPRRHAPPRWLARRPGHRIAVTAAAAAVVVAAVTVLAVVPGHSFLEQAAAAALRQPVQIPGPDQYIYTDNNEGGGRVEREWVSTDGNRPGLGKIWQGQKLIYDKPRSPCTVAQAELSNRTDGAQGGNCAVGGGYGPGYFADMPTNPKDLSAYLAEIGVAPTPSEGVGMGPGWLTNSLGKAVVELLPYVYLLPAQQAALYELLAQTPGFTIARGVQDAAGRTGIGIEWSYMGGGPIVIIFNPTTFAYMGAGGVVNGRYQAESALMTTALVNAAGQLP